MPELDSRPLVLRGAFGTVVARSWTAGASVECHQTLFFWKQERPGGATSGAEQSWDGAKHTTPSRCNEPLVGDITRDPQVKLEHRHLFFPLEHDGNAPLPPGKPERKWKNSRFLGPAVHALPINSLTSPEFRFLESLSHAAHES